MDGPAAIPLNLLKDSPQNDKLFQAYETVRKAIRKAQRALHEALKPNKVVSLVDDCPHIRSDPISRLGLGQSLS